MLQQSTVKTQILLGDTAYGTLDARDTMESQNVVPVAPLPIGSKKEGHFENTSLSLILSKIVAGVQLVR